MKFFVFVILAFSAFGQKGKGKGFVWAPEPYSATYAYGTSLPTAQPSAKATGNPYFLSTPTPKPVVYVPPPPPPTSMPTQPTQMPTQPTQMPTQPTQMPTAPTLQPTQPTLQPTQPTAKPTPQTAYNPYAVLPIPKPTPQTYNPPQTYGTCGPRVRREWGSLPDADRVLFIKALNELYKNNEVMTMAKAYFDNRLAINGKTVSPMFLMWHRVFLFDMEEKLRALPGYECVTIPYWNYHCRIPTDRRSPVGLGDNKLGQGDKQGCIEGPFSAVKHTLGQKKAGCIKRAPVALKITNLTCSGFTDMANIGDENFDRFATRIQNLHGLVHEAYGGNFATQYSPIDPLFWLHHANVDRLWALWQDCHSNYMPPAYAGAPSNLAAPYSAVTPADILDLAQMNWKGQKYAVMYSSDDWQDVGAYSTHFRQTLITVCQAKGGLQRYAKAVPVLGPGLDDQWALVTSPGTLAAVPTAVALTCQNSVLDEKQYPVLAVYAYLSLTECLAKCDKFFFTKDGESNCKCLSGKTRNAPAVRTSVLNHPEGKPYEVPVSQYTATCDSFLFDSAIGLRSLEGFDDLESDESSSEEIVLTNRMVALPGPSQSQDVCLAWIDTAVELRAPITCSAGAPRPRLSEKWLKMNNLALDAVEPCASYTAPAGRGSIQCIYK